MIFLMLPLIGFNGHQLGVLLFLPFYIRLFIFVMIRSLSHLSFTFQIVEDSKLTPMVVELK